MRRALLVLLLAGCPAGPTETTITTITDVCVDGDELLVTFEGCLSSSCDTLLSATCATEVAGGVITVSGTATVRSEGDECTADCGFIQARCPVPEVDDPSQTIVQFGGDDGGPALDDMACTGP